MTLVVAAILLDIGREAWQTLSAELWVPAAEFVRFRLLRRGKTEPAFG